MTSAVITPCSHFFHAGCLKKWLYVQETCPLCHSQLKGLPQSGPPAQDVPAQSEGALDEPPQPEACLQEAQSEVSTQASGSELSAVMEGGGEGKALLPHADSGPLSTG